MADDPTAATPHAHVPNTRFYDRFTGVIWWAVVAIAILLIVMALVLVR